MNRRRILTLMGFSTLLKAAEGRDTRVVEAAQTPRALPLPVDPVRTASLLLQDTRDCLRELTDVLLAELNGIPELKAAGLHFQRGKGAFSGVWGPRPASNIEGELFTSVDLCRRRESPSFCHLDLDPGTGAIRLACFIAEVLPTVDHPLWENDRFNPAMNLRRKPTITQ